jgi:hypothetical protein
MRVKRLKDLLNITAKNPDFNLSVTPLTSAQVALLADGLPSDHLTLLKEIGQFCLSCGSCLIIDTYIPCRLAESPFFSFDLNSFENFESYLIYAHDVDGMCYGYDTRSKPFGSCAWDYFYNAAEKSHGVFHVIERAIAPDLEKLGVEPDYFQKVKSEDSPLT